MHSTLFSKPSDDPYDVVVVAPDAVRVAPSDEELSKLLRRAARFRSDTQTRAASVLPAGLTAASFETTFRPVSVNDVLGSGDRWSMARRAVPFIALLLAACICLTPAWKSYGDVANKMIAKLATQLVLTLSLPPEKPALTAQPAPPAVQAEVANAASPQSATLAEEADRSNEPFGFSTAKVTTGRLLEKWLNIEREISAERLVLRICERNRASCQSQAALQFLAIVDSGRSLEGRARLGHINRAVNLKIKQMSDLAIYGEDDVWSSPLATLAVGAGDCEDYAIAKFVALQEAGVSPDDLRIVIMQDNIWKENHAVVAARLNGNWLMLDNRHLVMVEDTHVLNYHPVFLIDHDGVRRYLDVPSTVKGLGGYERVVGQIRR